MFGGGKTILDYIQNMKNDLTNNKSQKQININYKNVDLFTDGSQIREKKTYKSLGIGWAYIVKENKNTIHSKYNSIKEGNSQVAELTAIYEALYYVSGMSHHEKMNINVYSDSEYSIKSLTIWYHNWIKNNWIKPNKSKVKHREIIEPSLKMIDNLKKNGHKVTFTHVRSHTEKQDYISLGNAEVDKLASLAAKMAIKDHK